MENQAAVVCKVAGRLEKNNISRLKKIQIQINPVTSAFYP
jgi:hypothetical protein